jgi:hypothetical protein
MYPLLTFGMSASALRTVLDDVRDDSLSPRADVIGVRVEARLSNMDPVALALLLDPADVDALAGRVRPHLGR